MSSSQQSEKMIMSLAIHWRENVLTISPSSCNHKAKLIMVAQQRRAKQTQNDLYSATKRF